jgi:hypothetical protein
MQQVAVQDLSLMKPELQVTNNHVVTGAALLKV